MGRAVSTETHQRRCRAGTSKEVKRLAAGRRCAAPDPSASQVVRAVTGHDAPSLRPRLSKRGVAGVSTHAAMAPGMPVRKW